MKNVPLGLLQRLGRPTPSTCFLIKVVDGINDLVYGFTTLDTVVPFNDGFHQVSYSAYQSLQPQNIQQEASFETDNTELAGWFDEVFEQVVLAGGINEAEITIYRVCYLRTDLGAEVVAFGTVGEVDFSEDRDGKRKVEFRGLMQKLKKKTIPLYSLTCRASFGDEDCGMPFVWQNGTVSAVADNPYLTFTITGIAQADDYFNLGVVEFLTGDNAGAQMEVQTWQASGRIVLGFLTPMPVSIGDTVRIRRDCNKTDTQCIAYGNIINMRAEHLTPTQDRALMVPGAQIKSVGAK